MSMTIKAFQALIETKYGKIDHERGSEKTFLWFMEEVGELATAIARDDHENKVEEFGDVLGWLTTLANINGVDLTQAVEKYKEAEQGFK